MTIWLITQYHCDSDGKPYGEPYETVCYTEELMESYKNPKFVEKIVEVSKGSRKVVWTRER